MSGISSSTLLLFIAAVATQLIGVILLPRTAGFTHVIPTVACALTFVLSFGLIARMLQSGVNLSIIAPLVSAIVPLGAVAIGMFLYGESASLSKVIMLVAACTLIGFASRVA